MAPKTIRGRTIANPGNGFFRLLNGYDVGFSSITISQPDIAVALSGTLTFTCGNNSQVLDLAADRYLTLAGKVPFLDCMIDGVDSDAEFAITVI